MGVHKVLLAFLAVVGALVLASLGDAENFPGGCTPPDGPPCFPNTVPCAHCIGTWTDDWRDTYVVSSPSNPTTPGQYNVSGTATYAPSGQTCTFTYVVSGTINQTPPNKPLGTTELHWMMTHQSNTCGIEDGQGDARTWYLDATMTNNSCDSATGTWHYVGEDPAPLTMNKPADIPNGSPTTETSTAIGWFPGYPTGLAFEGAIHGTASFAGRQVFEVETSASDGCNLSGDPYPPYGLRLSGWFVGYNGFNSSYGYDTIALRWDVIDYYRSHWRTPCSASAGQTMRIYKQGTTGSEDYKDNVLRISLPDDFRVRVARDGQLDPCTLPTCDTRTWGIQTESLLPAMQGVPFTAYLTAAMGLLATPYTWEITEGSLPTGLAPPSCNDPCTTAMISGTPQAAGSYTFTVRVTDNSGLSPLARATRSFNLIVVSFQPGQLTSY